MVKRQKHQKIEKSRLAYNETLIQSIFSATSGSFKIICDSAAKQQKFFDCKKPILDSIFFNLKNFCCFAALGGIILKPPEVAQNNDSMNG